MPVSPLKIPRFGGGGMSLYKPPRDMDPGELQDADNFLVAADGSLFSAPNLISLSIDPLPINITSGLWTGVGGRNTIFIGGEDGVTGDLGLYYNVIGGSFYTTHVPHVCTTPVYSITSWRRGDGECAYYVADGNLRRVRYDPSVLPNGALLDEKAGTPPAVIVPTFGGATGDYYRYYITFVDSFGVESDPVLFLEQRQVADIDAANPLAVPAVPITAIDNPATHQFTSYEVNFYRQGHGNAELRQIPITPQPVVTTATPYAAWNDTFTDGALSFNIASFFRSVPPTGITDITVHDGRLQLITDSKLYYSRIGEPEAFYLDDLPSEQMDDSGNLDISPRVGDDLLGLFSIGNGLLVPTHNNLISIIGSGPPDFRPTTLVHTGAFNRFSVAEDADSAYMMGADRRIYRLYNTDFGTNQVSDLNQPIDERLRLYTSAQLENMRLHAINRMLIVDIPGEERLILSTRNSQEGGGSWTRQTDATTFVGDLLIKSLRPEDAVVGLVNGGDTLSMLRYEYVALGTATFSTTAVAETGFVTLGEGRWRATTISVAGVLMFPVTCVFTLKAHKRKKDGTIDTVTHQFAVEQDSDPNGDLLFTRVPSILVGEWFSLAVTVNSENLRLYGWTLWLEPVAETDGVL